MSLCVVEPATLDRDKLIDIVETLQRALFQEENDFGVYWDPDKEISGADFVAEMIDRLQRYDLVPREADDKESETETH